MGRICAGALVHVVLLGQGGGYPCHGLSARMPRQLVHAVVESGLVVEHVCGHSVGLYNHGLDGTVLFANGGSS